MKRWALLTVGLYMLLLIALAGPVACLCFVDEPTRLVDIHEDVYGAAFSKVVQNAPDKWDYLLVSPWMWATVMGLAQAALLVVPVRVASRKPVTTRWLVWPLLAALAMLLLMTGMMLLVVSETLANTSGFKDTPLPVSAIIGVCAVWSVWAFIFGFYTVRGGRANFMTRLVRSLIAGSILELLVAVPAHVLARTRGYCCAGFGTFWGIAAGISVMLFAFGPAVFVLFARRYGGLRRPGKAKR